MARQCSVERAEEKTGGFASARKHIHIQYMGRERDESNILTLIRRDAMEKGINDADIMDVEVYIKPEEQAIFYVINQKINGQIEF